MSSATETEAPLAIRTAMEARDLEAVKAAFAADAVLRSPLTDAIVFHGREQIAVVTELIFTTFEHFHYTGEARNGSEAFLLSEARVAGRRIDIAEHLRFNEAAEISAMVVYCRPFPAAAAALRVLGAGLGRRESERRGSLVAALTLPLDGMARLGDPIGARLLGPTLP